MNRREFLAAMGAWGAAGALGCDSERGLPLPWRESEGLDPGGMKLLARFVQITDTHVTDGLSPARFPPAQALIRSAWRPWEAYAAQIVDGIVRTVNRLHASGRRVDFVLHTGDATDNSQGNELSWLLGVMDGRQTRALSGPDDRMESARPPAELDPYAGFDPSGLYRQGVHGELDSIPWYGAVGNHDSFSIGVFAFFEEGVWRRVAPLPTAPGSNIVLPSYLDPTDSVGYGLVTPGLAGEPQFGLRGLVVPNPERRYFVKREFIEAMRASTSGPAGHGFGEGADGASWYSVSPVAGLRVITLDTSEPGHKLAGFIYSEGSIGERQVRFLREELAAAEGRGELVIVATHHPSTSLAGVYGTAASGPEFRAILGEHSNVILHVCGHRHRNFVSDWGTHVEIETCSTIDPPQEARVIEVYVDEATGEAAVGYEMIGHVEDGLPELGDDPLRGLREEAMRIAFGDEGAAARQKRFDESGARARGTATDRRGLRRMAGLSGKRG